MGDGVRRGVIIIAYYMEFTFFFRFDFFSPPIDYVVVGYIISGENREKKAYRPLYYYIISPSIRKDYDDYVIKPENYR